MINIKNLKKQKLKRKCVYRRIFPSCSIDFSVKKILPSKALVIMTQTDVLSPRTFCPHGRFVSMDDVSAGRFVRRTFCPHGRFVRRMFCLYRRFVPTDVLSPQMFCPRTFCLRTFCLQTFCLGTFNTLEQSQSRSIITMIESQE